jgi:hypothetical protein
VREQILFAFLVVHVAAGAVTAFVTFPIAAFATKGSRLHTWAGRAFVAGFFFLCAGGYVLEWEYLKGVVVDVFGVDLNVSPFNKQSDPMAVLNTSMVNTIALYFALSGWRVWRRAELAEAGRYPLFDSVIAVLEIGAGILFLTTLWLGIDGGALRHDLSWSFVLEGHAIIAAATAYVVFDAGHDLYIGVVRRPPRAWWRMHARKMIAAQMGLAAAFPYRCMPFSRKGALMMLVAILIAGAVGVFVARRYSKGMSKPERA